MTGAALALLLLAACAGDEIPVAESEAGAESQTADAALAGPPEPVAAAVEPAKPIAIEETVDVEAPAAAQPPDAVLPAGEPEAQAGAPETQLAQTLSREALDEQRLDRAEALFERFVALGNAHDPALAQLYADEAKIELIQSLDGVQGEPVEVSGRDFKALLPQILPRAAEAGESNAWSEIRYWLKGERVRIEAQRQAQPQGFVVPHVLEVGPADPDQPLEGRWLIYEEIAISPL